MENGGLCNEGDGVQVDPLPEYDLVCHLVCLHFALHLNVEDLQTLASCRGFSTVLTAFKYTKGDRFLSPGINAVLRLNN